MKLQNKKYIIVTGGVLSGLGKGVLAASVGLFFSDQYKVLPIKLDGYLNTDPGTMNPIEHGEVFILDDKTEADMDFGHYERFIGCSSTGMQSITMGKVFSNIQQKERKGEFLGKTVQFIPHVTNEILASVDKVAEKEDADIVLIEIGGTVGDIENELFIESMRQLKQKVGEKNICYLHLTYVPVPYGVKEQKSKPTQQSVHLLQSKGIWPDFVLPRCSEYLTENVIKKIALFGSIKPENVISLIDVNDIYKVPSTLENQNFVENICKKLKLPVPNKNKYKIWQSLLNEKHQKDVTITIAGKYTKLEDSYASIVEAIKHSCYNLKVNPKIQWIDTSIELNYEKLKQSDAIIVPGGFGTRGVEGKINTAKFARENKIPYLGICYGLQIAVVEFLRNVCNKPDAGLLETGCDIKNAAITMLDEQQKIVELGGTMRLGAYNASLKEGTIKELYKQLKCTQTKDGCEFVSERHRHRYEVNPGVIPTIEKKGLKVVGNSHERNLVEFIEMDKSIHPYFVATQAHPELKSKLEKPAPLFYGLIKSAIN